MECTKTYTIKGKRITVSWCLLGVGAFFIVGFIILERIYGPF